ncbi:hypothetical protein [Solidesulfovibrio magneticus]|uniref:Hypothetical membrane protein n=1 Tax=Solidesulfovibrio magneticus (strain ATCC 700980 / DSM 13731 / RS-1) TaxID=573370 RepID=C4XQI7_SOLM1|nr:hypothetical protein [Solidesulfovibrio magneticus]BAH75352.1 hypothetical membrane protein [Solidesulfovibrio magneticus RS-1]
MAINGAGGTPGGLGRFFLGLTMMVAGGYLFLSSIRVYHFFNMGYSLYTFGSFRLTTGMTLLPLGLGIVMIFYSARNILGWLLFLGSLLAICVGVIASIRFSLASMSLFDLLVILTLLLGGLGLFLSSLRSQGTPA